MNSDKGSETIKNSSIIFEDALSDTTSVALTRKRKFNKRCLAKKIMLAGIITALSLAVITLLAMVEKMYSDMRDVKLRLMSLEKEQVTREQVTRELLKQNNYSQAFLLDHLQSIVQNLSRSAVTQEQAELIALRVSGQEENLSNLQAIVGEVNYSAIINEGHLNSLQMAVQDLNHSVVRAKNCYDERHICRLQPRPNKVLYSRHCYTDEVDFLIPVRIVEGAQEIERCQDKKTYSI